MRNNAQQSSAILPNAELCKYAYYDYMGNKRDITIEAVKALLKETKLTPSALTKKAGLAPSTLNRKLGGEDPTGFSHVTLTKLTQAAGYDSYEHFVFEWFGKTNPYTLEILKKDVARLKDIASETLDIVQLTRISMNRQLKNNA